MFETAEIEQGTSIGKYEVLRKLATGGMAEIYLARVRGIVGFEKLVVLKRILPNVAEDPAFVQMFLDEARLAATLQHPNIADVYDVGSEHGSYFFTMEFIHGEDARTLRIVTRKRGEPVPLPQALAIVHGTASALAYAHDKVGPEGPLGLVHRDVSSSNVLISFDGAVKLVDFGIARATSRQTKTRTGTLKGKIPYMSPEQIQNRSLDRRSDLFSLGVVLYELTVGRRPFRGDSDFAIFDQIVNKGARPPRDHDPAYPEELERIVMRLLERSAEDRYQTAEELIGDLEAYMSSNNAWMSPVQLGRYMRTLFADKIAAWQAAEVSGARLGDHVASTITSESMRAEQRVTPVSAFTAQPEPMGDDAPTTAAPSAVRPVLRSSRRGLWIGVLAGLVAGAIGIAVVLGGSGDRASTPTARSPEPTTTPPPEATPPPPPTAAIAPPPAPDPVPVAAPEPAPETAVVTPPPPGPRSNPRPTTIRAGTRPATKPVVKPKPRPKRDQKDNSWDRNSLFLPP